MKTEEEITAFPMELKANDFSAWQFVKKRRKPNKDLRPTPIKNASKYWEPVQQYQQSGGRNRQTGKKPVGKMVYTGTAKPAEPPTPTVQE